MATLADLRVKIIEWAAERRILEESSPEAVSLKTIEEFGELSKAIQLHDKEQIKVELGDVLVAVIIFIELSDYRIQLKIMSRRPSWVTADRLLIGMVRTFVLMTANLSTDAVNSFTSFAGSLARKYDLTLEECLEAAYLKISNRKGQMVSGLFVKSE